MNKKIIIFAIVCSSLFVSNIDASLSIPRGMILSPKLYELDKNNHLTYETKRNLLFKAAEYNATKSLRSLEKAEECFRKITDIKFRDACTGLVLGALAQFCATGSKAKLLSVLIVTISNVVGKSCDAFWEGYDHLQDARVSAARCDALQEMLWTGNF